ncbi:MAG: membrane protein of unknown function [Promethearchaeota archaeon]|nr:MAG: membrane protein of unknown function [Candidatus Lokiarchaeota archaeon]
MYKLDRIDKWFLLILTIGIILRILALVNVDPALDSYTYYAAAKNILNCDYNSFRAPGFPIFLIPFLLIPYNYIFIIAPESKILLVTLQNPHLILTAQIASLFAGLLLIIYSYVIFSKVALKLPNETKTIKTKTISSGNIKLLGLFVSILISLSLPFIINSAQGLREQLLSLLIIIIFYYILIKEELTLRNNIVLALSISFLTLTHITGGLFITGGILLFFLVSKLKWFKYKNISNKKILVIILTTILSFFLWAWFCDFKFHDPLYSLQVQRNFFKNAYNLDLSSPSNLISALLNGLLNGIPSEFYLMFLFNGVVFMLLVLYILLRNLRERQFLFIFLVVGSNLTYLSIFMAIPGDIRLIMYFFPLLIYLGSIPLNKIITKADKSSLKKIYLFLILFITSFSFRGLTSIDFFRPFFKSPLSNAFYWILILINELSLLIFIIKYRKIIF